MINLNCPKPEKRIAEFEKMGFGLFIHFGLYSLLEHGEWEQDMLKLVSDEEYFKLSEKFSVENFNAENIARFAKDVGIKYIVLTSKHHEGFALYDMAGINDFDVLHSPARRDLVKEFVTACNNEGIAPFLYHTTLDWHEESFETNFSEYKEYLRKSVELLCVKYGKISGFWFDGNWSKKDADWEEDKLYGMIRNYQPDAMIINNSGIGARGELGHRELDSVTFEQGRPKPLNREGMPKYLASEMCVTLNNHWGWSKSDFQYKSLSEIIESLCACRKVGANFLLNIGLMGDGSIPLIQKSMLYGIGAWMKLFGEAIYEGKPAEIYGEKKNFGLAGEDGIYLFFHDIEIDGGENVTVENKDCGSGLRTFTGITKIIKKIEWLDNGAEVTFKQDLADKIIAVDCEPYPYGTNYVVRVAKCILQN